jgi:type IV pilus assembly protein PilB
MARKKLGEILIIAGLIDELQLQSALGEQRKWGRPLGQTLVEMGILKEIDLIRALSSQLNIPAVDINKCKIDREVLTILSYEFCSKYCCIPFHHEAKGNFLDVAMADPTNIEIFDLVRVQTRCNMRPHIASASAIEDSIGMHFLGEKPGSHKDDNRPFIVQRNEMVFETGQFARYQMPENTQNASTKAASSAPAQAGAEKPSVNINVTSALSSAIEQEAITKINVALTQVRAQLDRDEKVIRKILALLLEKGVCTREELIAKIHED